MRNPLVRILLVIAVVSLVTAAGMPRPAAAADRTFTLFGDDNAPGWGPDLGNITNPGPTLTVDVGDNVTLMLTGADGTNLRWYIDYNNNSNDDAGEPRSPTFDDNPAPTQWNFTADRVGTYTYRSVNFEATMTGTITIRNVTAPGGGTPFGLDTTLMIVLGLTVGFVALLLIASVISKRKKQDRTPEQKS